MKLRRPRLGAVDGVAGPPRSGVGDLTLRAFTLMEVMIALTIFFMAIFTILQLTSQNLHNARILQRLPPDLNSLAAELSLTNNLVEGEESGDFGDLYPDFRWRRETYLYGTNGLFQVDFTVFWSIDSRPKESRMSILLYRPDSSIRGGRGRR